MNSQKVINIARNALEKNPKFHLCTRKYSILACVCNEFFRINFFLSCREVAQKILDTIGVNSNHLTFDTLATTMEETLFFITVIECECYANANDVTHVLGTHKHRRERN